MQIPVNHDLSDTCTKQDGLGGKNSYGMASFACSHDQLHCRVDFLMCLWSRFLASHQSYQGKCLSSTPHALSDMARGMADTIYAELICSSQQAHQETDVVQLCLVAKRMQDAWGCTDGLKRTRGPAHATIFNLDFHSVSFAALASEIAPTQE